MRRSYGGGGGGWGVTSRQDLTAYKKTLTYTFISSKFPKDLGANLSTLLCLDRPILKKTGMTAGL